MVIKLSKIDFNFFINITPFFLRWEKPNIILFKWVYYHKNKTVQGHYLYEFADFQFL